MAPFQILIPDEFVRHHSKLSVPKIKCMSSIYANHKSSNTEHTKTADKLISLHFMWSNYEPFCSNIKYKSKSHSICEFLQHCY